MAARLLSAVWIRHPSLGGHHGSWTSASPVSRGRAQRSGAGSSLRNAWRAAGTSPRSISLMRRSRSPHIS
jgi:hypothetical protein